MTFTVLTSTGKLLAVPKKEAVKRTEGGKEKDPGHGDFLFTAISEPRGRTVPL